MAWSTRQLAELADTTVKTVRHYHAIGLLDVPERASNGYKQYGVSHLIRLVQIKRLSELGIPLAQIAAMERADEEPDAAIRALDAELEATIARLTRVRAQLAVILRHRASPEVPPGFAPVSGPLSETKRSLLMVYSTVFSEEAMEDFRQMLAEQHETDEEFEAVPPDADDDAVELLARRMAPEIRRGREKHPWSVDPAAHSPRGRKLAESALASAVAELYNPAQIRVLQRVNEILAQEDEESADDTPTPHSPGSAGSVR
ncbi:helix-turn-helix domain-containing protein [Streptomonospora litoralis]|uniref:HTH-type transcriptional activator TipA n=1 Tax=Streptomonospora litoralis TaxID=2498135 RepID=A0A4P6Q637_9ACTN|nr:MerR family transcriptional regulator [Streptomonospora litoralis]QBI55770.1 HTH-type transcriptional activator TipA [Streptomonospora litoralis]